VKLSDGYKYTEIGTIPVDWEVYPLGQLIKKVRLGGNYANQDAETELPLMKMGNIARGSFDLSKVQFIKLGVLPDSTHRLMYGDVLFNTRNTLDLVGKTAIWCDELPLAYYNSNLLRLEFDSSRIFSNEFVNYYLNHEGSISRLRGLATGTTSVAAIYTRDLLKLKLVVPPPSEQKAISLVLCDVDALIATLDKAIAKKRNMKQAVIQQLLTGKVRLPGFVGAWTEKLVEEFGQIVTGGTPSTSDHSFWGEGYPWITPTDISVERDMFTSERTITRKGLSSIRLLPANTVLVTCIASIGKNAILRTVGGCNQQINAIIPNDNNCAEFLYYLMEISKDYLVSNAGMTATAMLSKARFSKMKFFVPDKSEQIAISKILSEIDEELSKLEQRRNKTKELKQAIMQELLTGKTRLIKKELGDA
jgi:type I restriction enzyme S subunit